MKRLFLLRHAKAVSGDPKSGDHNRVLNERGRRDAPRMAGEMRQRRYLPDSVLCSTASRTVETWALMAPELDAIPDVKYLDGLYLAPWTSLLGIVRRSGHGRSVLVVGHNPGLEELGLALAREPHSERERMRLDALNAKFPTSALAVLDFDIENWKELEPATGKLTDIVRPKDLSDG